MPIKTAPARVKAAGPSDGLKDGQFRAVVSVFNNKDSYGDVVMPGAFAGTLEDWKSLGDPIPVLYSHNRSDPDYNIGYVLDAKETEEGLEILAQLDIDADAGKARQVHRLLKGRRVTQFSFAYDVLEGGEATRQTADGQDETYYELRKLKLYEVGPCLIGANQETRLIGAKAVADGAAALAQEIKAGRVLSASNEKRIRTAVDELSTVLSALESEDEKTASGDHADAPPATPQEASLDARRSPVKTAAHELLSLEIQLAAL